MSTRARNGCLQSYTRLLARRLPRPNPRCAMSPPPPEPMPMQQPKMQQPTQPTMMETAHHAMPLPLIMMQQEEQPVMMQPPLAATVMHAVKLTARVVVATAVGPAATGPGQSSRLASPLG